MVGSTADRPPQLDDSVPKRFRAGTHRLIAPDETMARLQPLLPVMGITRIANITGLDTIGIPVVMVCRPNSRSLAVSQGKGLDLPSARVSGVMESIELHHAERIHLPLKWASHEELRFTHSLVPPDTLVRTSLSHFHRDAPILWIEGHDCVRSRSITSSRSISPGPSSTSRSFVWSSPSSKVQPNG